jgi:hypothetical protein
MDMHPHSHDGTVVLFSGKSLLSQSIRWRTWSRYSHVGLLAWTTANDVNALRGVDSKLARLVPAERMSYLTEWFGCGKWLIYESTTQAPRPCAITGLHTYGVQTHELQDRVNHYDGTAYLLPWLPGYWFSSVLGPNSTSVQLDRSLVSSLLLRLGTPYDPAGAGLLGSCLLKYVWPYDSSDRSSVFCSEFVARQISLQNRGRLPVRSPSRWTPGGLARTLTKTERVGPPIEIKKTVRGVDANSNPPFFPDHK